MSGLFDSLSKYLMGDPYASGNGGLLDEALKKLLAGQSGAPAPAAPGAVPAAIGSTSPLPGSPVVSGGSPSPDFLHTRLAQALKSGLLGAAAGSQKRGFGGALGAGLLAAQGVGERADAQHRAQQQEALTASQIQRQTDEDAAKKAQADQLANLPAPPGVDPQKWEDFKKVSPQQALAAYGNQFTPDKPTHSAIYTEWQDAVANGYKGDLTQYQNEDANRRRPVTNINQPEPLVQIQGDNGPVYVPRSQAVGKAPPQSEPHKTADQQDWDVLNYGDPSSREFHAAYARQTQPKMQMSADGTRLVPVPPQLPKDLRQPVYTSQGPAAGSGGTQGGAAGASSIPALHAEADPTGASSVDLGKKPLTEEQAKAAGFATRTRTANEQLEKLISGGYRPSLSDMYLMNKGGAIGHYAMTAEARQFDQARRNFINAVLRRESGAAISASEFDNANSQYFPMPNDDEKTLEMKATNRQQAIEALANGSGPGATQAPGTVDPLGIR